MRGGTSRGEGRQPSHLHVLLGPGLGWAHDGRTLAGGPEGRGQGCAPPASSCCRPAAGRSAGGRGRRAVGAYREQQQQQPAALHMALMGSWLSWAHGSHGLMALMGSWLSWAAGKPNFLGSDGPRRAVAWLVRCVFIMCWTVLLMQA